MSRPLRTEMFEMLIAYKNSPPKEREYHKKCFLTVFEEYANSLFLMEAPHKKNTTPFESNLFIQIILAMKCVPAAPHSYFIENVDPEMLMLVSLNHNGRVVTSVLGDKIFAKYISICYQQVPNPEDMEALISDIKGIQESHFTTKALILENLAILSVGDNDFKTLNREKPLPVIKNGKGEEKKSGEKAAVMKKKVNTTKEDLDKVIKAIRSVIIDTKDEDFLLELRKWLDADVKELFEKNDQQDAPEETVLVAANPTLPVVFATVLCLKEYDYTGKTRKQIVDGLVDIIISQSSDLQFYVANILEFFSHKQSDAIVSKIINNKEDPELLVNVYKYMISVFDNSDDDLKYMLFVVFHYFEKFFKGEFGEKSGNFYLFYAILIRDFLKKYINIQYEYKLERVEAIFRLKLEDLITKINPFRDSCLETILKNEDWYENTSKSGALAALANEEKLKIVLVDLYQELDHGTPEEERDFNRIFDAISETELTKEDKSAILERLESQKTKIQKDVQNSIQATEARRKAYEEMAKTWAGGF